MPTSNNTQLLHDKTTDRLNKIASGVRGVLGLMVKDLTDGRTFSINPEAVFPQASAIKIPILMELYKQAGEGRFKLSDPCTIDHAKKTPGSGFLFELGDSTVTLSLHDLAVLMILVSDNTATNILIDLVGMENVNRTMESLGFRHTRVARRMMDFAAAVRGDENLSTAAEACRIMELLHRGEFLSRAACDEILTILKKHKATAITAGLPEGIQVAGKPGGIPGVTTEWSIVLLKARPYIVTVMVNYGMEKEAGTVIQEISRVLFEHFSRLARATSHGTYVVPPSHG